MNDDLSTISGCLATVWRRLEADDQNPFRTPVLATSGSIWPEARMVVIRHASREDNLITFWTNRLSSKVQEIENSPKVSLLCWDADDRFQARIRGTATPLQGPKRTWSDLPPYARALYARNPDPGTIVDDPAVAKGAMPDLDIFACIDVHVEQIETLWLTRPVHRRAVFDSKSAWSGAWIAP